MTMSTTIIKMAQIATLRRRPARGMRQLKEEVLASSKLDLQYLQVSEYSGQMPPQFGHDFE